MLQQAWEQKGQRTYWFKMKTEKASHELIKSDTVEGEKTLEMHVFHFYKEKKNGQAWRKNDLPLA